MIYTDPSELAGALGRPRGPDALPAGPGPARRRRAAVGGARRGGLPSPRHPRPLRALPPRHLSQRAAPADRQVSAGNLFSRGALAEIGLRRNENLAAWPRIFESHL